jgi:hypothetical protein
MRARKHAAEFDASRIGLGACELTPDQLPAFADWLHHGGHVVVTGTNGVTDKIVSVTADGSMRWANRGGRVQCVQAAHLGQPLAAEFVKWVAFLKEVASAG